MLAKAEVEEVVEAEGRGAFQAVDEMLPLQRVDALDTDSTTK